MAATLWLLLTAAGFGILKAIPHAQHAKLKQILVRVAAFSFTGAGVLGASGWIGQLFTATVGVVNHASADAGTAAIGTGAVWVVWLFASAAWVLTLLPESWFGREIPDWLSVSGMVLPALASSIPGPIGDGLQRLFDLTGGLMIHGASRAIGAA